MSRDSGYTQARVPKTVEAFAAPRGSLLMVLLGAYRTERVGTPIEKKNTKNLTPPFSRTLRDTTTKGDIGWHSRGRKANWLPHYA